MLKKIFFILIVLFTIRIYGQGSVATPYSTQGWETPIDSTAHYDFSIFRLLSNPGGYLNLNTVKMDSLIYDLIVYTDSSQMVIRNDTLVLSSYLSGTASFTTTATYDSVAISGMDSLDVITVTPISNVYNVNDILSVWERTGYFLVYRNSTGGTSGLKFNYIYIKRY